MKGKGNLVQTNIRITQEFSMKTFEMGMISTKLDLILNRLNPFPMQNSRWTKAIVALFFTSSFLYAQENQLEIYSEMGEKFTVYLNGAKQNDEPVSNLLLKDLPNPMYKARIEFEDASKGMFLDNVYTPKNLDEPGRNTYVIQLGKKGYKLKFFSFTAMNDLPPDPEPTYVPVAVQSREMESGREVGGNVQGSSEQVNVSMNIGGTQIGVNVSSSSSTSMQMDVDMPMQETQHTSYEEEGPAVIDGDGCTGPMSSADFSSFMGSMKGKSFEDSKDQLARQAMKSNCFSSEQVREIMKAFQFEETRLEFAKAAYAHVYDRNNYYKVNDAFQFELSIDELNEYLEGQ